ncbi:MAG: sialic acid TRAP transporter substrate-binding protein SiaP [Casimicrobiaceae bacterium]
MHKIVLSLLAMSVLLPIGSNGFAETLKFAHVYEVSEPFHKQALWAAEEIKKRTAGRYDIQVFPASSLGKEQDLYQGLALGSVDMAYTGSFYASRDYGPMALASAPFMFRDYAHWTAFRDSPMYKEIREAYTAKTGNQVLALVYYGDRHVTANRPVRVPADMKGMKFRTPDSPLYTLFPKAVGANPTPIAFAEVYLALQNGTVDGQENPLPTILAKKFYEVNKNISLTGHMTDSLVTLVAPGVWKKLSPADQKIFQEVYAEAALKITDEIRALEAQLATDLATKYGANVITVDRKPFREAVAKELQAANLPWTPEQYQRVQAIK